MYNRGALKRWIGYTDNGIGDREASQNLARAGKPASRKAKGQSGEHCHQEPDEEKLEP